MQLAADKTQGKNKQDYKKPTRWVARNEERLFALFCLVLIGDVWTGLLSVNECDSKKQKNLHTMLLLLTNTLLQCVVDD